MGVSPSATKFYQDPTRHSRACHELWICEGRERRGQATVEEVSGSGSGFTLEDVSGNQRGGGSGQVSPEGDHAGGGRLSEERSRATGQPGSSRKPSAALGEVASAAGEHGEMGARVDDSGTEGTRTDVPAGNGGEGESCSGKGSSGGVELSGESSRKPAMSESADQMHLLETLSPDDLKTHSESFDPRLFSCRESTQNGWADILRPLEPLDTIAMFLDQFREIPS